MFIQGTDKYVKYFNIRILDFVFNSFPMYVRTHVESFEVIGLQETRAQDFDHAYV